MQELVRKGNVQIDGRRDLNLSLQILKDVANDSRVFNDSNTIRKLDAFDGIEPRRVFLHYVNLIDAGFIEGGHNIQDWTIAARFLTWEGHELLENLEKRLQPTYLKAKL